jgi:hypothetical protein
LYILALVLSLERVGHDAGRVDFAAPGAWLVGIQIDVTFGLVSSVRWSEIVQIIDNDLLLAALGARLLSLLGPAKRHVSGMRRTENGSLTSP